MQVAGRPSLGNPKKMKNGIIGKPMRMTADDIRSGNRLHGLLFSIMIWGAIGFICAQAAYAAVPVDIKSYDPASGVAVRSAGEALVIGWDMPEGSTELTLNVSGRGADRKSVV